MNVRICSQSISVSPVSSRLVSDRKKSHGYSSQRGHYLRKVTVLAESITRGIPPSSAGPWIICQAESNRIRKHSCGSDWDQINPLRPIPGKLAPLSAPSPLSAHAALQPVLVAWCSKYRLKAEPTKLTTNENTDSSNMSTSSDAQSSSPRRFHVIRRSRIVRYACDSLMWPPSAQQGNMPACRRPSCGPSELRIVQA